MTVPPIPHPAPSLRVLKQSYREWIAAGGTEIYGNVTLPPRKPEPVADTPYATATLGEYSVAILTLTSAQLLALHTTPVELIPAPGKGLMVAVGSQTSWSFHHGTTPYVQANPITLQYGGGTIAPGGSGGTILTGTADVATISTGTIAAATPIASLENRNVVVTSLTNPTGGDGTLTVSVPYTLARV